MDGPTKRQLIKGFLTYSSNFRFIPFDLILIQCNTENKCHMLKMKTSNLTVITEQMKLFGNPIRT